MDCGLLSVLVVYTMHIYSLCIYYRDSITWHVFLSLWFIQCLWFFSFIFVHTFFSINVVCVTTMPLFLYISDFYVCLVWHGGYATRRAGTSGTPHPWVVIEFLLKLKYSLFLSRKLLDIFTESEILGKWAMHPAGLRAIPTSHLEGPTALLYFPQKFRSGLPVLWAPRGLLWEFRVGQFPPYYVLAGRPLPRADMIFTVWPYSMFCL